MPKFTDSLPKPPWRQGSFRLRRMPILLAISSIFAMALFYVLISMSPCMVGSQRCYKGYTSAYSFDAYHAHHPRWMTAIPDDVNLTSLSIPGTHDTMTYGMPENEHLQCQIWNLTTQLNAGLRYFDIRARLQDDELKIYHSSGFTGFSYTDVLVPMFDFLDENPGETIIMRLKEEGVPIGDHNTISFEDALIKHHESSPVTSPGASKHLYHYNQTEPLPNLGALRSRIFLLQNFVSKDQEKSPYGLIWEGPQMALEDLWIIPDIHHLVDKWNAIRSALEAATRAPLNNTLLYLAHISASVGVLPIEAAAGPKNKAVVGMNDLTGQWLRDFSAHRGVSARIGVVIIDFPGRKLIDAVLRWNEHLTK